MISELVNVVQINATLNEISATLRLLKVNDGKHISFCINSCILYDAHCPDGSVRAAKSANNKVKVSTTHTDSLYGINEVYVFYFGSGIIMRGVIFLVVL